MTSRGDLTWVEFWNRYCRKPAGGYIIGLCIMAVLFVLGFLIFQSIHNELLLRELQRTGDVAKAAQAKTWIGFVRTVWFSAAFQLTLIMAMLHLSLYYESRKRHERIIDFPWYRVWPWIFVLVTIVPGILIYSVSAVHLIRDRRQRRQVEGDQSDEGTETEVERIRRELRFYHEPDEAGQAYRMARIGDRRRELERARDDAKSRLEWLTEEIGRLAARLKSSQQQKGGLLAEVSRAEAALENLTDDDSPEETRTDEEFKRLMQLPGVIGVRVVHDHVCVLVRVVLQQGASQYFQGIWEIRFAADGVLRIESVRSGVKRGWPYGKHPDYRDHAYGLDFCMGRRKTQILELAKNRHFLEAVELLIDSMFSVNPEDESLIPDVFEKVGKQ